MLSGRLNLNFDELDLQVSRAHRTPKTTEDNDIRPIFDAFVDWRYADDIRKRMIQLHTEKKSRIIFSQMFSKELTQRRNEALKKNTSGITSTQHLLGIPSTSDGKEKKQSRQVQRN